MAAGPAARGPLPPSMRPHANAAELPPPDVRRLLDSIHVTHFLDAGLNCRGVHVTDPQVVSWLGVRRGRVPLQVHLHGTPRQWGDRRRPWIAAEKDRFHALMALAGFEPGTSLYAHTYFEGQPASLRQHFDIISAMRTSC